MKSKFYSDWKRKVGILSILTKYNNMKDSEENYYQSMSQFQVELFANAGNSKVWTNRLRENLLNDLFHSILAQKLVSSIWFCLIKQWSTKGNLEDFYPLHFG
jgi:hypothetical protein